MITYYTDGLTYWLKRTYKKQCKCRVFLNYECQGVKGHEGDHWCYTSDGSYCYQSVKGSKSYTAGIAGGMTPPEHKNYIQPKDKRDEYYIRNYDDDLVTDKRLIKRLEAGKLKKDESIESPAHLYIKGDEI